MSREYAARAQEAAEKNTNAVAEVFEPVDMDVLLQYADTGQNIAELLTDGHLGSIAMECISLYEEADRSREGWKEHADKAMELALQISHPKNFPWEGAANIKFPLLTVASLQFAARAYPQIVREPEPVKGKVNGFATDEKIKKAIRIGKHMSYQIMEEMEEWPDDMDRLLHVLPILGIAYKKTFYDPSVGRNRSVLVYPKDLVYDYYAKGVEEARFKAHRYTLHPQDIIVKQRQGIFLDVDLTGTPQHPEQNEVAEEFTGIDHSSLAKMVPREHLECHTWLDLDGDGLEEPYIVHVDYPSKRVLRIEARYDVDSVSFTDDGKVAYIEPWEYFTEYRFLEDPSGGNLGFGWGRILYHNNEAVNAIINQLLDAGARQNIGGGFIGKEARLPKGELRFQLGEWKQVNAFGQDLRKAIFPLPTPSPSPVLFQLLGLLIEWGQRITSVTDLMIGENPPINQPATTTLALLEQGQKVFAGIYARIYRAFGKELKKLKRLNAKYLDPVQYFRVLDPGKNTQENVLRVFINDYQDDQTDVVPSADPRVESQQVLLARGRVLIEAAQAGLPINPYYAAKVVLRGAGIPDTDIQEAVLPPRPPQPDPKIVQTQAKLQMDQQKLQVDAEIKRMKLELDAMKNQMRAELQALQEMRKQAEFEWQKIVDQQRLMIEAARVAGQTRSGE